MRRFIIAPMASGKTTYVRNHPNQDVFDVDDARVPEHEPELQRLRHLRRWPEHAAIWHRDIQSWAAKLPAKATILIHSFFDARALGASPKDTVVVIPIVDTHLERMRSRELKGDDLALAKLNRFDTLRDAQDHGLRVFSDISSAVANAAGQL